MRPTSEKVKCMRVRSSVKEKVLKREFFWGFPNHIFLLILFIHQNFEAVLIPPLHMACVSTTVADSFPQQKDRG